MTTTVTMFPRIPKLWEVSGSSDEGWYIEGESDECYPDDHPHEPGGRIGWFSMELPNWPSVVWELRQLGMFKNRTGQLEAVSAIEAYVPPFKVPSGYELGGMSYCRYLDEAARESYVYFMVHGTEEQAEEMFTRSYAAALRGNDGE